MVLWDPDKSTYPNKTTAQDFPFNSTQDRLLHVFCILNTNNGNADMSNFSAWLKKMCVKICPFPLQASLRHAWKANANDIKDISVSSSLRRKWEEGCSNIQWYNTHYFLRLLIPPIPFLCRNRELKHQSDLLLWNRLTHSHFCFGLLFHCLVMYSVVCCIIPNANRHNQMS